uniref:Uncharacterized protein n=1 Tax=Aegilops tauschii TaxID=37682 RepID=M8CWP9_AEGTA
MRSALGLSHWCSLLLLLSLVTAPRGLEVGDLFSQGKPPAVKQDCSRTCESKFCTDDYLNTRCNENLLGCLDGVNPAGPTFPGNKCSVGETAFVIKGVIEAAVLAGKILHKRDIGQ